MCDESELHVCYQYFDGIKKKTSEKEHKTHIL
jgi:hypothetical protein